MARHHHRYDVVLGLILVTLAFMLAAPDGDGARLIAVVLQASTLIAAVVAGRAHRWVIRGAVVASVLLVLTAIGTVTRTEEYGDDSARVISLLLVALAPPAIVTGMVKQQRERPGITRSTMFGALCIYLLLGMFFSASFNAAESLTGESFFTEGAGGTSDYLYFSFATLTTTGYGDLVPATNLGRSLAITEALIAQIYLVTVVAVIVAQLRLAMPRG